MTVSFRFPIPNLNSIRVPNPQIVFSSKRKGERNPNIIPEKFFADVCFSVAIESNQDAGHSRKGSHAGEQPGAQ